MSISIDPRKLEKLERLSEALELLQNPEGYARMIAEARAVIQMHKEVSARYATIDAADRFLQDSRKVLEAAKKEAAAVEVALKRERTSLEDAKRMQLAQFVQRETALRKRELDANDREGKLQASEASLAKTLAEFRAQREAAERAYTEQFAGLAKDRAELDKRKAALAAAMQ